MAKYNAARHTIETDDGRHLATLARSIDGNQGFRIADGWAGAEDEDIEELREALRFEEYRRQEFEDANFSANCRIEERDEEIRRLKEEIATLKEKGAPAA